MNADEVDAIAARLTKMGIKFVVVGGSALEREFAIGTGDVDLLVAVADFDALETAFQGQADIAPFEPTGTIGSTRMIAGTEWIEVEFIVGGPFAGDHGGDAFVRYVRAYRSEHRGAVCWARPEVVWYMRLCTDDWRLYVTKIRRDLRAGVPESTFEGVRDVAVHFGVEEKIGPRIAGARAAMQLFGPPNSKR